MQSSRGNKTQKELMVHIKKPYEFKAHVKVLSKGVKIYTVKIIFVGNTFAGKTSLIRRWIDGKFPDPAALRATIGIAFHRKDIKINEHTILRLQIWDIAGAPRYFDLIEHTPSLLGGAAFILMQFELYWYGCEDSLSYLEDYIIPLIESVYKIDLNKPHPDFVAILGNKVDLVRKEWNKKNSNTLLLKPPCVSNFLEKYPQKYFSVSAESGEGVQSAMDYVIDKIKNKLSLIDNLVDNT